MEKTTNNMNQVAPTPRITNVTVTPSPENPENSVIRAIFDNGIEVAIEYQPSQNDLMDMMNHLMVGIKFKSRGHFTPDWDQITGDVMQHLFGIKHESNL